MHDTRTNECRSKRWLFESEEILMANTTTEEPLGFIERARKAAAEAFVSYKENTRVVVGFNCNPGKCSSMMASNQSAPLQQCLDALRSRLATLTPPKTSGPVGFGVYFQVHSQ